MVFSYSIAVFGSKLESITCVLVLLEAEMMEELRLVDLARANIADITTGVEEEEPTNSFG